MSHRYVLTACVFFLGLVCCAAAAATEGGNTFPDGYTQERFLQDKENAEKGDADVQFVMGYVHHRKVVEFVEPDVGTAFGWYKKAADQGHVQANQVLGLMYQKGEGVEASLEMAKRCYQYAADRGLAESQYALGVVYGEALGVPRDEELAMVWYKKAVKQNFSPAALVIGAMYAGGRGVPKDLEVAFNWFLRSAELGNGEGMLRVSSMYRTGTGVAQDIAIAIRWLEEAVKVKGQASFIAANDLAWVLATCQDERYRDSKRALSLAERLVKSGVTKPGTLDTLAAACAANGLFERAVQVQQEAMAKLAETGETDLTESFRERLDLYKKGKTWIEP